MNWLIWIPGWIIGYFFFLGIFDRDGINEMPFVTQPLPSVLIWTLIWIWLCWRFIR